LTHTLLILYTYYEFVRTILYEMVRMSKFMYENIRNILLKDKISGFE